MKKSATLIGFAAILMWAFLALLTVRTGNVPPFQLTAMTFLLGGSIGAASWLARPHAMQALWQDWRVWLLGVGGLFGYHLVYFFAIRQAPAVEVSLIAYLWPLFIVVLSTVLLGERLRWHHLMGVVLGLMGAGLVITRGQLLGLGMEFSYGHLLAFACAFIWSIYSVLSRRVGHVSTDAVAGFCLVTGILSSFAHLGLETTVWPDHFSQWLAIVALGLVPLGIGFYAWDYGVKHGDIMILGALSYAAPLLSTIILVIAGETPFHWSVAAAAVLITSGALIAAKDMFRN